MNKTVIYKLNENNLREKLEGCSYSFDESLWQETVKSLDALGLQRKTTVKMGARKVLLFAGLLLLGGGLAAFINYNSKQHRNSNKALVASASENKGNRGPENEMMERTGLKVGSEIPQFVFNRHATIEMAATAQPVKENKEEIPAATTETQETIKIADNSENKKEDQPSAVSTDTSSKQETVSSDNQETKKKKKKRRKRRRSSGDGNSTVSPTAGEDDVIISE